MRLQPVIVTPEERRAIEETLRPCPHCGPLPAMPELVRDDTSGRWQVFCGPCGSSSGSSPHPQRAADSWNSRHVEGPEIPSSSTALIQLAIYLSNRLPDLSVSNERPIYGFTNDVRQEQAFALAREIVHYANSKLICEPGGSRS